MKADMEATKEKMTTMMEAMMSMRKMMEVNMATVVAASIATEVNPTHPPGLNQVNRPVSDMVGWALQMDFLPVTLRKLRIWSVVIPLHLLISFLVSKNNFLELPTFIMACPIIGFSATSFFLSLASSL